MNTRILFTAGAMLAGLFAISAPAQTPGAVEQVDKVQQQRDRAQAATGGNESAPELYPGESSDVGPQSVLRVKPRRTWFDAQADVQFFYTDNMFLTDANKIDTMVLLSTVQLAIAPTPFEEACGTYAPRVGYRHQWFNFGLDGKEYYPGFKLSEFDFNVQTVFTDLTWSRENWQAQIGFDYQRLLTSSDYHETYHEYVPRWGVQRTFRLCDRSSLAVGYEGNYRFTEQRNFYFADLNDRTDQALFATCTYSLCRHAVIQPFYRFKYTQFINYPGPDRHDTLHSFGASLYWLVCPNFNVRFFAGYDIKCSNLSYVNYNRFDAGGGVNLNFRF
jgi:hypothetical protein